MQPQALYLHKKCQADWPEVSRQLDSAYREQGGEEAFRDMRDRLRERLYEETDISGGDTAEAIETLDQTMAAAQEGMDSLVRNFDETLSAALALRDDPDMGRATRSPQLTQNQITCLQFVGWVHWALMLACLLSFGCWCCAWYGIYISYGFAIAGCLAIVR
jgi:hypothetical protein